MFAKVAPGSAPADGGRLLKLVARDNPKRVPQWRPGWQKENLSAPSGFWCTRGHTAHAGSRAQR